jgi:hypothetical protein
MAVVFISHAHSDEAIARRLAQFLQVGLGLTPEDFFLSSQEGHGVAPAESIRSSIESTLHSAQAFVVLMTTRAAGSAWVWLEAGGRLATTGTTAPIFVLPSERFVSLLAPVADTRCLQIEKEGELHELLKAVGKNLNKTPTDVLTYRPALEDLRTASAAAYGTGAQTRQRALSFLKAHGLGLAAGAAGLAMLIYSYKSRPVPPPAGVSIEALNQAQVRTAQQFLVLNGIVSSDQGPVAGASVMASRQEVRDPSGCHEPDCTWRDSTTEGEFTIDLTKIQANNHDSITLSIVKPGFAFYSKEVQLNVRVTDGRTAPQTVVLAAAR